MVHYRRNWIPGGTFFLTVALADRRSSVLADHIALLQMAFRNTKNLKPFAIDAVVILPEHLHAILILPPSDADYSGRWKSIKAWFTRGVVAIGEAPPRDHRGEYLLWQRRFWEHTIRDDQDLERCTSYIDYSPVKHGLVSTPAAWPYSSLHRYVRAGLLPADLGGHGGDDSGHFGERED
ncbi:MULTISPECIES: REP-associated tyrosine transposase [unclassified Tardiphaga]|uniref:REP-associated tyrosine transposase n=1 Tax=unclassified Tardiphaga TaxID=2631404 RepID=UPI0011641523|nr:MULTISPECIES: transposase [unclassified Tardiphaga]QDM17762.1 transposase [Tardiphaga sp. vice278]QDM22821.1 transposase [Tardiphaga sp. vice154]